MSIDLHTHSTASDGTFTPTQLVRHAKELGLSAIALTDHDTFSGLDEAREAGEYYGVEVIRGCELSLESPAGAGWLHMVALWVPENPTELQEAIDWVIEGRLTRNHEIVEKLRAQGVNITYEAVAARADGTIGRPHFAQELVHLGVVSSINEAFQVWIGDNGRAYVPKRKLKPKQALDILNNIGATSILAHPFALGLNMKQTEKLVAEFKEMGLDGLEVIYSEHSEEQTKGYWDMAVRHNLLISGGSDFHGEVKPHIELGTGKGGLHVPDELLMAMKERRKDRGLPV
ncbi:PHP domain-containing protein [Pseudodesulfovibrio cashew]|uniref:PHP domain-containing protein n=1 Tax=Pseudodesulfovibrio cashew TaxID=2678688 RepID=A0A6I6JF87_9BACT|nr:PHP domain-containing protein [Pseudodesulfovibrio cashew]QGY39839.1 PHP domain-containing protein [Pseudodesulfovibrio cashew]